MTYDAKSLLVALVAVVSAIALAACGSSNATRAAPTAPPAAAPSHRAGAGPDEGRDAAVRRSEGF